MKLRWLLLLLPAGLLAGCAVDVTPAPVYVRPAPYAYYGPPPPPRWYGPPYPRWGYRYWGYGRPYP